MDRRVALITGASRGIGRAIAKRLAKDGRHVVAVARNAEQLQSLTDEIIAAGGSCEPRTCNLADGEAVQRMVEEIAEKHGRLDILVNNAGITKDGLLMRMSDADFDEVINVNLRSVFIACRAASRPMLRGKFGRVVNIGSVSGVAGNKGQANYAAAKAGVIGLTKSIAKELGAKGITANVVAPGFVETDMTAFLGPEDKKQVAQHISVGRLGIPEDIAAAVAYLTGDDAGYITGQVLVVDGGLPM